MKAIIQQFQKELTAEERRLFEANAALAGRRPGVHLKCILFGEKHALTAAAEQVKRRRTEIGRAEDGDRKGGGRRSEGRRTEIGRAEDGDRKPEAEN